MPIYKDGKNKNADGLQRYRVRINYTDGQGQHKQLTRITHGLQQAKQLEMLLQAERKEPAHGMTIQVLFELYLSAKRHEVRETSLQKITVTFEHHILPFMGEVKTEKVDVKLLQGWKSYINEKPLQIQTKQTIYSKLRAFLNWCVKGEYIVANPLNKVYNFKDAYETPKADKMKYYTAEQYKAYIAAALSEAERTNNFDFYVFFNLAFYTGMRKGEIHALKWSDIEGNKINVRRSIAQKLKGEDRETPPKNKTSYRTLQAPRALMNVLEAQRLRHRALTDSIDELRVCGGDRCLRDTTIDHSNRAYATAAGLPRIAIHDFRHSHASLLANAGINIQEVARRLGHAKIEQTWNTYSHLYPQEEERALQVLDNI